MLRETELMNQVHHLTETVQSSQQSKVVQIDTLDNTLDDTTDDNMYSAKILAHSIQNMDGLGITELYVLVSCIYLPYMCFIYLPFRICVSFLVIHNNVFIPPFFLSKSLLPWSPIRPIPFIYPYTPLVYPYTQPLADMVG